MSLKKQKANKYSESAVVKLGQIDFFFYLQAYFKVSHNLIMTMLSSIWTAPPHNWSSFLKEEERQYKGTKVKLTSLTLMSSFNGPEAIMINAWDTGEKRGSFLQGSK